MGNSQSTPLSFEYMKKEIEQEIADAIMERPIPFRCGHRQFYIYPVTLGKMYVLQKQYETLEINPQNIAKNTSLEFLRLAEEKKRECCTIIAIHTCKTKDEIFSPKIIAERRNILMKKASKEDIASFLMMFLSNDKTAAFIKYYGIDKEQERLHKVMEVKEQSGKNSINFGAKSLYGSFIHPLLEMGFSWEEIVWQRSYTNLRMLLADKPNSVYVTDEELKKLPASVRDTDGLEANDPENAKRIMAIFKNKGIEVG